MSAQAVRAAQTIMGKENSRVDLSPSLNGQFLHHAVQASSFTSLLVVSSYNNTQRQLAPSHPLLLSLSSLRAQGLAVALTHGGMLPKSNMRYPQVLTPKLMHRIPMMFSMKPAFTWKNTTLDQVQTVQNELRVS